MWMVQNLKWVSTACVLTGILLTSINIYPLNIVFHSAGAIGWTTAGVMTQDKALMTNFGLQLPLFMVGFAKVFGVI